MPALGHLCRLVVTSVIALAIAGHVAAAPTAGCPKGSCAKVESVFNAAGQPPLRVAFDNRLSAAVVAGLRKSDLVAAFRGLRRGEVLDLTVLPDRGAGRPEALRGVESIKAAWRAAGLPAERLRVSFDEGPAPAARRSTAP